MKTRNEIAPEIDRRRFAEVSSALEKAGVITPRRLGPGQPTLYTPEDAATIRQVLDCPDALPDALRNLSGRATGQAAQPVRTPEAGETGEPERSSPPTPSAPDPAEILRQELQELRARMDAETTARAATEREAQAVAEQARAEVRAEREAREKEARELAEIIERERAEREKIRIAADLEQRHAVARISSLETSIKRGRPRTWRERIRAAWTVLTGDASAVPLLPETSSAGENDFQKAA